MTLSRDRAEEIISRFPEQRILVIGDLILDRYVYGSVRRISPEAPVPVVHVTQEKSMPGGASNVAWNIQALGGKAEVSGLLGRDGAGESLLNLLRDGGVGVDGVLSLDSIQTTVKTRVIAERQQVVRVDREQALKWSEADRARFCELIVRQTHQASGSILEDYGKGVVDQSVVRVAIDAARARAIPIGYDPKSDHVLEVHGVTFATPNRKEAYETLGRPEPLEDQDPMQDKELLAVGRQLLSLWGAGFLAITLGPQGMLLLDQQKDSIPAHVPTRAREVFDVSGAGDTVIGVCTLALAAGATHLEAAELANYAAGVVVAKLGTATCTPDELLDRINA